MEITYLGHSCFMLKDVEKSLLLDPFISANALAENIQVSGLKPDYILLSHGHQDHILDVETIYSQSNASVLANYEVGNWFQNKGMDRVITMNQGGTIQLDSARVKLVNAIHSSSMPDGSYGGNPVGFVIKMDGRCLYYAGDTALHQDMKQIKDWYSVDLAVLPIGGHFTMDLEDALTAADFVGCNRILGMHYDTFPPIAIDHQASKNLADSQGKELILMQIGSSIKL
jgi:L-ascorbate metabolism protein UlaG (beta-lactamase superfamily)